MRRHAAMSMHTHPPQPPMPPGSTPSTDWARVHDTLRRTALGLTGRVQDAEELTQQTFAHLLARAPDKLEHAGYVRQTMLRLWLDEQRSMGRRMRRYAMVARVALARSPGESAADTELTHAVRERIEGLPAQQRAALVLRLVEGLEYEQIAEALGTSVGAVRANLHLARRALGQALGGAS